MVRNFYDSLAALRPEAANPLIALVVSDEAATYRPEMEWLALQLQLHGQARFACGPRSFPLGSGLFFDVEGNPEKIDIIYRFFELFDLANIRTAPFFFEAWKAGEVAIAPPMRHFRRRNSRSRCSTTTGCRISGPKRSAAARSNSCGSSSRRPGSSTRAPAARRGARRPARRRPAVARLARARRRFAEGTRPDHQDQRLPRDGVGGAQRRARQRLLARRVAVQGLDRALELAPTNLHVLQAYKKPKRVQHPVYRRPETGRRARRRHGGGGAPAPVSVLFCRRGRARLSGALATFCPPDKKIIHGMQDAALLPCRVSA
jgi:hypothetical protein